MDNGKAILLVPKMLNFIASGGVDDLTAIYYPYQLERFGEWWERAAAHLLELGYVQFTRGGYVITETGLHLVQGWRNTPEHQKRELDAEINRLEIALEAARLRRAALEPKAGRGEMTEAGITRLIGDSLQNGE